jgi:type I restriction enzyme S subunit
VTNFESVQIHAIGSVGSGTTPLRAQGARYFAASGHNWVKTGDLNNSRISDTDEKITDAAVKEANCRIYPVGTVLVAMYGGFKQIGRTGLLTVPAGVNQAISAISVDRSRIVPEYLLYYLNYNVAAWRSFAASSRKDPNITRRDVESFRVLLPHLPEQRKIAEVLRTWDDAIDGLEQLKKLQSARREAMISKLLFGEGAPHGTTWARTTRGWNIRPIGDIAKEAGSRNAALSAETVLTCSKHLGFVRSDNYFSRTVHSADLSNYKLVHRDEFAFPSNHVEEGSIGLQNVVDTGAVSPIYTVFAFNGELVDPRFAYLVLKSQQYAHMFRVSTSATVDRRGSLRWPEFSKLPFPVPPMETQKRIVQIIVDFDEDLARSTKLTALYRDQKRGFMQKLLTGEIRVTGDSAESPVEVSDE